ncbi:hypothetical protein ABT215_30160 [Streptomyces sp900105755]|uniref:hypothetical protein n=1 Tax=Streptomyces sp. 900105755 TaxID=3154389 RepID=UPI0033181DE5
MALIGWRDHGDPQILNDQFYDESVRAFLTSHVVRRLSERERFPRAQNTMQYVLQLLRCRQTTQSVVEMRRNWEIPGPNRPSLRALVVAAKSDGLLLANLDVMVDVMHATGLYPAFQVQDDPLRNIVHGGQSLRELNWWRASCIKSSTGCTVPSINVTPGDS